MAESQLPPGKKRYMITLTEKIKEKLADDMKYLGLPREAFSLFVDEMMQEGLAPLFGEMANRKRKGGNISLAEIFALCHKQLERAKDEMGTLEKSENLGAVCSCGWSGTIPDENTPFYCPNCGKKA